MESRRLSDGREIPVLALGVWQIRTGPSASTPCDGRWNSATATSILPSFTATRRASAEPCANSGLPREELFITTKFAPSRRDPAAEAEGSLRRLGLDFVDLYLVHWPQRSATRAWPGMEKARQLGYTRSIGVSNYGVHDMDQVMRAAEVAPVVNQVQFSPFEYRRALLDTAIRHNIVVEAYSPLGTGRHLADPRARGRITGGPFACSGLAALVPAARHRGSAQVDAPRPHRGERHDLRLRALRRRPGRAGQTGHDGWNGRGRRSPMA